MSFQGEISLSDTISVKYVFYLIKFIYKLLER